MGTKAKTRIVVRFEGRDREVASVRQLTNGDLLLIRKGEDNHFRMIPKRGEGTRLVEHRISVHRSDKSLLQGTTIKMSILTDDGCLETASSFVKYSKKNLCWHMYSSLSPDLSYERYEMVPRDRDSILKIAEFDTKDSCLMYHIFVTSKNRSMPRVFNSTMHRADLKLFSIVVYCNFLNFPQMHMGMLASIPTASPQLNGEVDETRRAAFEKAFGDGAVSIEDSEVHSVIHTMNETLFRGAATFLLNDIKDEAFRRNIETHQPLFTRLPLALDQQVVLLDQPPFPWSPPNLRSS